MVEKLKEVIKNVVEDFPEMSIKIGDIKVDPDFPEYSARLPISYSNLRGGHLRAIDTKNLTMDNGVVGTEFLNMSEDFIRNLMGHEFSEMVAYNKHFTVRILSANILNGHRLRDSKNKTLRRIFNAYVHWYTDRIATSRGYISTKEIYKEFEKYVPNFRHFL